MSETMIDTKTYEVGTIYCDGTSFLHFHEQARGATFEFANQLAEALEPTMGHPHARHIRVVTLAVVTEGEVATAVSSDPLGCEHKEAGGE